MTKEYNENMENLGQMVSRNLQLLSSLNQRYWDAWMVNLGSVSWMNEQCESMMRNYLEQRKEIREEMVKVAEEMAAQLQKNLAQVEDMVRETWVASVENISIPQVPGFQSYRDLVKQVDELSKKIEENK
ncbi:MAG: hypothetical protein ACM3MK_11125 [Chitinophagales bacterium]